MHSRWHPPPPSPLLRGQNTTLPSTPLGFLLSCPLQEQLNSGSSGWHGETSLLSSHGVRGRICVPMCYRLCFYWCRFLCRTPWHPPLRWGARTRWLRSCITIQHFSQTVPRSYKMRTEAGAALWSLALANTYFRYYRVNVGTFHPLTSILHQNSSAEDSLQLCCYHPSWSSGLWWSERMELKEGYRFNHDSNNPSPDTLLLSWEERRFWISLQMTSVVIRAWRSYRVACNVVLIVLLLLLFSLFYDHLVQHFVSAEVVFKVL